MSSHDIFVAEFKALGERLCSEAGGWEVRFETPPGPYLHVSKPSWGDESMNGVHLEAYLTRVSDGGEAVVALHCESGCPGGDRETLMTELARRIEPEMDAWTREEAKLWTPVLPRGINDCTVVESRFSFSEDVLARIERLLTQMQRTLAPSIDAAIESVVGSPSPR